MHIVEYGEREMHAFSPESATTWFKMVQKKGAISLLVISKVDELDIRVQHRLSLCCLTLLGKRTSPCVQK